MRVVTSKTGMSCFSAALATSHSAPPSSPPPYLRDPADARHLRSDVEPDALHRDRTERQRLPERARIVRGPGAPRAGREDPGQCDRAGRGTDTEDSVQARINKAAYELSFKHSFHHVIVNSNLELAVAEANQLVGDFLK